MKRRDRGELPRGPVVERERLLARLAGRFDTRITTVVGGAGSGKTTLLAQMLLTEHEHTDIWYPVRAADRRASAFTEGLLRAARAELDAEDHLEPEHEGELDAGGRALAELVLFAAPGRVCFVLDDAHLLPEGVLDDLIELLPANGHVLAAGRTTPPVSVARLAVRNDVTAIDQDDLLFDDDELVSFANRRGVDVGGLRGADRWPAFVELAVDGRSHTAADFLREETLADLGAERRRGLARFALVGGGDDAMAIAVAGMPLEQLIAGLPLVRWSNGAARLHDMWVDLLLAVMVEAERVEAAGVAARHLLDVGDIDRAIHLAAQFELFDIVDAGIVIALRSGLEGGLRASLIERWLTLLSAERLDGPVGLLARGVIERDRDPSAAVVRDLLDRAATEFSLVGDRDGELLALQQLVFVARFSDDPAVVSSTAERLGALASEFPPARPYLRFVAAFRAISLGRPDLQLEELDALSDVELPPMWRSARENLRAHALYMLGRPAEALDVVPPTHVAATISFPGGSVTESQALWFAGRPHEGLASQIASIESETSARDRFKAHAWIAVMASFAGRVELARDHRARAERLAGEVPPAVGIGQLVGVDILLQIATGAEAEAAVASESLLEFAPLGQGVSEQNLRTVLALPYLLVPSTREYWESIELGPAQLDTLELARALVAARRDDLLPIQRLTWPLPGIVAANLPVRWAVEFSLHGVRAGVTSAHRTVRWLCEHWGAPARSVLGEFRGDDTLGDAAAAVWVRTPLPPRRPVRVEVLGAPRLLVDGDDTANPDWRRERVRALLVWLIIHRDGSRDQLAGALWPDLTGDRAAKNLRTTLNLLHHLLEPDRQPGDATWFVQSDGPWIRLRPDLDVDLTDLLGLLDAADQAEREGQPSRSLELLRSAIPLYRGDLASDLDLLWLDLDRVHVRSRFVRGTVRLAELLRSTGRPDEAIEAASVALRFDPYHERALHAMADSYVALGDRTASAEVMRRLDELGLGEL